jgi:hypothetical protein
MRARRTRRTLLSRRCWERSSSRASARSIVSQVSGSGLSCCSTTRMIDAAASR